MRIVTVVETPEFQRRAASIMTDAERHAIIDFVARNPGAGTAMGGGIRKVRFARTGSGKSGGYRTIHFWSGDGAIPIFLLTVFAKNEKANLTRNEAAKIRQLATLLSDTYRRRT
jgi:hypothetical protein